MTGKNYLNDKIIDQYMKQIQRRNQAVPDLPKAYACTTFLYTQLKRFGVKEGCKLTERWTPDDFLENDLILLPIHHQHHWSLIVVEIRERTVHYFDSLYGSRHSSAAPRTIKMYMEEQHRRIGEETEYTINVREDAPLQYNGVDCGVFVCQYAERMARKSRMDFTQKDMAETRERMIQELMKGEIALEWESFKRWGQTECFERKRQRKSEKERGKEKERKIERKRKREREKEREKERKGKRERERQSERERDRESVLRERE